MRLTHTPAAHAPFRAYIIDDKWRIENTGTDMQVIYSLSVMGLRIGRTLLHPFHLDDICQMVRSGDHYDIGIREEWDACADDVHIGIDYHGYEEFGRATTIPVERRPIVEPGPWWMRTLTRLERVLFGSTESTKK